jgi:arylsulfatase A-like enzyme
MAGKLPNIVLIVMDTAGAKHLSLYGYRRETTPHLARLAEKSTVYTRCFAPGCWTTPSHGSLFTGLYPAQHGAYEGRYLLYDKIQHLVPALKMAGYRTYGISSNFLVAPATGMCLGFDYFVDFSSGFLNLFGKKAGNAFENEFSLLLSEKNALNMKDKLNITLKYILETGSYRNVLNKTLMGFKTRIRNLMEIKFRLSPLGYSARYTEKTIKLAKKIIRNYHNTNNKPFLLFINFIESHQYYRPPSKYRNFSNKKDEQRHEIGKFYSLNDSRYITNQIKVYHDLYDDEIYYLDNVIYRIWSFFKEKNLLKNTIFIITSDHGEHFGEKGHYGHELSLYNELIWVPLIIRFPEGLVPKGVNDRLVSLNDLYSTLLDLANLPLPRPDTSVSLLDGQVREVVLSQIVNPGIWKRSLQSKREKYSLSPKFSPPVFAAITAKGKKIIENQDGSLEIYDFIKDPDENHDLTAEMPPETVENLRHFMNIYKKESGFYEVSK